MYLDCHDIAARPAIRELASLMRRLRRVDVVLSARGSMPVRLGAPSEDEMPWLDALGVEAHVVLDASGWSERSRARSERVRHVDVGLGGLGGVCIDVTTSDGRPIARLVAHGFVRSGAGASSEIALRQRLHARGVSEATIREVIDAIPILAERDELVLAEHLEALAALAEARIEELERTRPEAFDSGAYCGMIGTSPHMRRLFSMMEKAARSEATVLILGENGTGKELVANGIHRRSRRAEGAFVVQNCAAIPPDLMESELFGHKRGAFSGAHKDRDGLFVTARSGTFFLDEIGEMDVSLQSKLLRVLQEGTFLPVGASERERSDARVVCATNRDLVSMVRQSTFRQDLYYRLAVITLHVPALRERRSDIPALARHFAAKATGRHGLEPRELSERCIDALQSYDWPGNVRELENEVERTMIMNRGTGPVPATALSPRVLGAREDTPSFSVMDMPLPEAVEQLERHMILERLRENDWNKTQAARALGISRRNLIRKVARYGFDEETS